MRELSESNCGCWNSVTVTILVDHTESLIDKFGSTGHRRLKKRKGGVACKMC